MNSDNNPPTPLLHRPGGRAVIITLALVASHGLTFLAGWESARQAMLHKLDAMAENWDDAVNEAFGEAAPVEQPQAQPDNYNPQSYTKAEPEPNTDESDSSFCWGGEPCESATVPGVYYVHVTRNGGPARWPLPDLADMPEGCDSATETPCYDEATGFNYGVWRGSFHWYNPNAAAMGISEEKAHGWQAWDDSEGLATTN